jgi:hypothetical protein
LTARHGIGLSHFGIVTGCCTWSCDIDESSYRSQKQAKSGKGQKFCIHVHSLTIVEMISIDGVDQECTMQSCPNYISAKNGLPMIAVSQHHSQRINIAKRNREIAVEAGYASPRMLSHKLVNIECG